MNDRFYTTIEVSGPDADAAAKSAMEAFLNQPKDEGGRDSYCGSWCVGDETYFDHSSGQGAVLIVTDVSRKFPEATFHLFVNGGMAEGFQGPVRIQDGTVTDGRTEEYSYGGPYDTAEYIAAMAPFKEQPVPDDAVRVRLSPVQRIPFLEEEIQRLREKVRTLEAEYDKAHANDPETEISMADVLGSVPTN